MLFYYLYAIVQAVMFVNIISYYGEVVDIFEIQTYRASLPSPQTLTEMS